MLMLSTPLKMISWKFRFLQIAVRTGLLFSQSGAALSTHIAQTAAFTPVAADWRYDTVSLDSYRGFNDVLLKFKRPATMETTCMLMM